MAKLLDKIFVRGNHTCPWWFCFSFDNPLRSLFQNPVKILAPFIHPGYTVLDVGPGRGYFTISLSLLVGSTGKVIALDIQKQMLDLLQKKANRKKCTNIVTQLYDGSQFGISDRFDFILLFWMFHEVKNKDNFLVEMKNVCKKAGKILLAEPIIHVTGNMFEDEKHLFEKHGFKLMDEIKIGLSRALLFEMQ